MSAIVEAAAVLAASPTGKAGPVALFVLILLCVSVYFLMRSMTRHLRKVREGFPGDPPPADREPAPPTTGAGGAG
jgi:hypothetical protein